MAKVLVVASSLSSAVVAWVPPSSYLLVTNPLWVSGGHSSSSGHMVTHQLQFNLLHPPKCSLCRGRRRRSLSAMTATPQAWSKATCQFDIIKGKRRRRQQQCSWADRHDHQRQDTHLFNSNSIEGQRAYEDIHRVDEDDVRRLMSMATIDIKLELQALGVYHKDLFEKMELARRLVEVRKYGADNCNYDPPPAIISKPGGGGMRCSTRARDSDNDADVSSSGIDSTLIELSDDMIIQYLEGLGVVFSHLSARNVLLKQLDSAFKEKRKSIKEAIRADNSSTQLMKQLNSMGVSYNLFAPREELENAYVEAYLQKAYVLGGSATGARTGAVKRISETDERPHRNEQGSANRYDERRGDVRVVDHDDDAEEFDDVHDDDRRHIGGGGGGTDDEDDISSLSFKSFESALKWARRLTYEDVLEELDFRGVDIPSSKQSNYEYLTRLLADTVAVEECLLSDDMSVDECLHHGLDLDELDGDMVEDGQISNEFTAFGDDGSAESGSGGGGGGARRLVSRLPVVVQEVLHMFAVSVPPAFRESTAKVGQILHSSANNASFVVLKSTANTSAKGVIIGVEAAAEWAGGEAFTKEQVLLVVSLYCLIARRGLWSALALLIVIRTGRLTLVQALHTMSEKRQRRFKAEKKKASDRLAKGSSNNSNGTSKSKKNGVKLKRKTVRQGGDSTH